MNMKKRQGSADMNLKLSRLFSLLLLIAFMGCATLHANYQPGILHTRGGVDDFLSSVGAFEYGISVDELKKRLSSQPLASCEKGHYEVREVPWPKRAKQPPVQGPYYLLVHVMPNGEERPLLTMWLSDHGLMKYRVDIIGPPFAPEGVSFLSLLPGAPEAIQYEQAREDKDDRSFAELYWKNLRAFEAFLKKPHTWQELEAFLAELARENPPEAASLWEVKEAVWDAKEHDRNTAFRAEADPDGLIPCVEGRIKWDKIMAVRLDEFQNYFWHGKPYHSDLPTRPWRLYDILANIYLDHGRIVAVILMESPWYDCDPMGARCGSGGPAGVPWYDLQCQFKIWYFVEEEPQGTSAQRP
jgi:hypothetical protein